MFTRNVEELGTAAERSPAPGITPCVSYLGEVG